MYLNGMLGEIFLWRGDAFLLSSEEIFLTAEVSVLMLQKNLHSLKRVASDKLNKSVCPYLKGVM